MPKDLTMKRDNQNQLAKLSWKPNDLVASVRQLAEDAEKSVVEASDWYMAKRKLPSGGARWSRILAIAFVTLGGLAPLIQSTFGQIPGPATVTGTGIGYLFLALAAACVALDRYAGFSSSWMRRVTTAQAIKRLVVEFRVQWPPLLADVEAKEKPTAADIKPLFDRVAKLAGDAEDLIKEETRLWKVEFESAFAQLEKATQAGKAEAKEEEEDRPVAPPPPPPPAGGPQAGGGLVPAGGVPQPTAATPVAAENQPLPVEMGDALLTPPNPAGSDGASEAPSAKTNAKADEPPADPPTKHE
jgi:hypothetical protein